MRLANSFALSLAAVLALAPTLGSAAQQPQAAPAAPERQIIKMGMIDINAITHTAKAFKSLRDQMDKLGATVQADLKKEQTDLQQAQQDSERQKNSLAPDAFARERDNWGQRYQALNRKIEMVNTEMSRVEHDAAREAETALYKVTEELAKENNFTLIFRREMIFMAVEALDITPTVIERLDKALPAVKVGKPNFDKPAAAAQGAKPAAGTPAAKPATSAPAAKPPAGK